MKEIGKRLKIFSVVGVALLVTLSMGEEFRVDEGDPSASVSINYQDGRYEVRKEGKLTMSVTRTMILCFSIGFKFTNRIR